MPGKVNVRVISGNKPDLAVASLFANHPSYHAMYPEDGKPDLVVFTGGADINPSLYGELRNTRTSTDLERDYHDMQAYRIYKDIPKVGICRGAQFLNVMSGGSLYQHVTDHLKNHEMVDLLTGEFIEVTSTHHQMMIPGNNGVVLGIAYEAKNFFTTGRVIKKDEPRYDTEVVFYPKTKSLCYQPHPEIANNECKANFFQLIRAMLQEIK